MTDATVNLASDPRTFELVIFTCATLASIVGFLCCVILYAYTKWQTRPARPITLHCLYLYGAIFWGGTMLLTVDWMMGDKAPVAIRPPLDWYNRVGFASLICVWAGMILALFLAHRVIRVVRKPAKDTPEGRNLLIARAAQRGHSVDGIHRHAHTRMGTLIAH